MIDVNLGGVWKSVKGRCSSICLPRPRRVDHLDQFGSRLEDLPLYRPLRGGQHGVVGLMRTFAVELGAQSIRVNSVHPTHVNTPLLHNEPTYRMFRPDLESPGPDDMAPVCQSFHMLPIPWVTAEDISNAVLFLPPTRLATSPALPFLSTQAVV